MYSFESKNTLLSFEIDVINMEPFLDDANSSNFFFTKNYSLIFIAGMSKGNKMQNNFNEGFIRSSLWN